MIEPNSRELAGLLRALEDHAGLQFTEAAVAPVQRRMCERAAAAGYPSLGRYLEYLTSPAGQHELGAALDVITTSETYFMRQHYQLKAFQEEVLPRVLASNAALKKLTIWSAGCSTGEEAYTIATLLHGVEALVGWKVRVLASDLSAARLGVAREGRYGRSSFRAVDDAFKQRFFTPGQSEGEWCVKPEIRKLCHFVQTNLAQPGSTSVIGTADVVFCRNVLIYLSPRAREVATLQLVEQLAVGGYLLLGHAESLLGSSLPIDAVHLKEDVVYRRREARR